MDRQDRSDSERFFIEGEGAVFSSLAISEYPSQHALNRDSTY